jgi:DNA-binding LacI/PurR family transcriptional regulator
VRQVLDGIREAVSGGYYRPGDLLPDYRALAATLGVSPFVTKMAIRRLAQEGVLEARPSRGTIVRGDMGRTWRGHVVFVRMEAAVNPFLSAVANELRVRLNRAGYLFTLATVEAAADRSAYDFSLLDAALSRSVDLVIARCSHPAVFRHLAQRGVAFAAVADLAGLPAGAAGLTRLDYGAAIPDFLASCRAGGISRVKVYRWRNARQRAPLPQIRGADGIAVRTVFLEPDVSHGASASVEATGYNGFRRLFASRRFDPDALHLFSDDYLARGAFLAIAEAGLRIPEDIRVATWANAGIGPFYPRELSRMEMDAAAAGATLAAATLEFLSSGHYPCDTSIGPVWRDGETMRAFPS